MKNQTTQIESSSKLNSSRDRFKPGDTLHDTDYRFRIIFEHSNDAIFIIDPFQDKIIDCNPKASEILGFSHEELLKKRVSEIHPKEMPQLLEFAKSVYQQGHGWTNEFHCLTKQGIFKPTEISASIFQYQDNNYLLAIVRDISERKATEKALRESERRFRTLVESAMDAFFVTDPVNGKVKDVNKMACQLLGYSREELLQLSVPDFMPNFNGQKIAALWKTQLDIPDLDVDFDPTDQTKMEKTARRVYEVWRQRGQNIAITFEDTFRCKDGSTLPVEVKAGYIELEEQIFSFAIARDIRERKQAEEARNRLVALIENSPDFIGFGSLEMPPRPLYINQAGLCMVGLNSLEDIKNLTILDFFPEPEKARYKKEIIPKILEQGHWEGEAYYRHFRTGKAIPVHRHLFTIKDQNGQPIGLGTITRDITALKKIQRQLERARAHLEKRVRQRTLELAKANEKLQKEIEERRKQLTAIESSLEGIAILNARGQYVYMNQAHAKIYGYDSAGELLGKTWRKLYNQKEKEKFEKEYIPKLFKQGRWQGEVTGKRKDGSTFDVQVSLTALEDGGLVCVCQDISQRKQFERALQESEALFRKVFEESSLGMTIVDLKLRYQKVNHMFCQMLGYSERELLGKNIKEITHPQDRKIDLQKAAELFQGKIPYYQIEKRFIRKDGEIIWGRLTATLIRDAQGKPLFGLGMIEDISQRKQAEEALKRYAKRLETLQEIDRAILAARSSEEIARGALQHIQELIPCHRATVSIFDFEKNTGTVLATFARKKTKVGTGLKLPIEVFGLVEELKKGKPRIVDDVLRSPQPPVIEKLKVEGIRSFLNMPLLVKNELIGTLNMGSTETGAFTAEHLEIAREVADTLAIAIHQARLNEQLRNYAEELEQRVRERTAELESFSYSVSHDLRAPLRAIDGFSRILEEEYGSRLDAEGQRLLGIIRNNTKNMGQLIDDLLVFSRLGRKELQFTEIDLEKIARDIFNELTLAEPHRKITLTIKKLPAAFGDASMIRQVMLNLISNAIKFTRPKKNARIEIGVNKIGEEVVYYVKDNGVGFDMKYVDKIFGVFQRLHTSEEFEGTGVGLAIVQRVIYRHGGKVWAKGQINKGATIYFTLPKRGDKAWFK